MSISYSGEEQPITAATSLPEDLPEGSLRPRTIDEYIGQEKAKENKGEEKGEETKEKK